MKIYTKTGDKGKTSLFDGTRVRKDNIRVDAYGTLDELNSMLGFSISQLSEKKEFVSFVVKLRHIQNDLFDMGAMLANPSTNTAQEKKQAEYLEKQVKEMERDIDNFSSEVPEQLTFILPGSSSAGASLHVCRTICRRAERRIITLTDEINILPEFIKYINRLSDFLFAASRWVNHKENQEEIFWKKTIV